jgi:hypothetical protein
LRRSESGADRTRQRATTRDVIQSGAKSFTAHARICHNFREILERSEAEEVDVIRGFSMLTDK